MEYAYATCILNESGEEINEKNLTAVLEAANCEVQESRVKALVAALEDIEIDSAVDFDDLGSDPAHNGAPSTGDPSEPADSDLTDASGMDLIPAEHGDGFDEEAGGPNRKSDDGDGGPNGEFEDSGEPNRESDDDDGEPNGEFEGSGGPNGEFDEEPGGAAADRGETDGDLAGDADAKDDSRGETGAFDDGSRGETGAFDDNSDEV